MQITLTDQDAATLKKVLDSYVSDLRMEIADTEAADFREKLKREESLLMRVIEQLGRSGPVK